MPRLKLKNATAIENRITDTGFIDPISRPHTIEDSTKFNGSHPDSTLKSAQRYKELGFSVIPIALDGSKAPSCSWKNFQIQIATKEQIEEWFEWFSNGIGIVCGKVSGNLEVLDIEGRFKDRLDEYLKLVEECSPGLLARLVMIQTPSNGKHLYYSSLSNFDL